jgi:hypothetical protein
LKNTSASSEFLAFSLEINILFGIAQITSFDLISSVQSTPVMPPIFSSFPFGFGPESFVG